jgi:RNA polymerase sigma-70 factor (ECF subfamily)
MLVALLKLGDPAAWKKLKDYLARFVLAWTRHLHLNREVLEDVMQEVFLAVQKRVAGFKEEIPDGDFYKWLKRVTTNKAIDHLRSRQAEPEAPGGDFVQALLAEVPERTPADGGGADHLGDEDWALRIGALRRARAGVENKTWLAAWRLVADGRMAREVAREVGMTVRAVNKAVQRVICAVRREYAALVSLTAWDEKTPWLKAG